MPQTSPIKPLFKTVRHANTMGNITLELTQDNYNKKTGAAFIDAENDAQAIAAFLNEYKDAPETLRSYSKEIERLLLWCLHVGRVNIASLRRDHLLAYQAFLKNPTPKTSWCGSSVARVKKDGTWNKDWRPFVKGLSNNSIHTALNIVDSFLNYLVQTNYLTGNPMASDRSRKRKNKAKPRIIDRYLEWDEIDSVLTALEQHPVHNEIEKFQVIRARYILLLLFYTGLRISEAANHRMGNCLQREDNWFLRITGKGKKIREIPLPDALLQALSDFRRAVGLSSSEPKFRERTPLIPMQNLKQSISPRRISQILQWAFELGAQRIEADTPRKASKLRKASAHWLRHSYVTYLLESGAPLKVVQENAGHSDVGTTMHYRHVAQIDRHAATRDLSLMTLKSNQRHSDKKQGSVKIQPNHIDRFNYT